MPKDISTDMQEIANQVATAITEVRGIFTGFVRCIDNIRPKIFNRKGMTGRILERRSVEKLSEISSDDKPLE